MDSHNWGKERLGSRPQTDEQKRTKERIEQDLLFTQDLAKFIRNAGPEDEIWNRTAVVMAACSRAIMNLTEEDLIKFKKMVAIYFGIFDKFFKSKEEEEEERPT